MDAVTLTLPKALELASILSKYVDVKTLDPHADPIDFIRDIVNAIVPADYLRCVMLLTQKDEKQIEQEISLEILTAFIEGLKKNQVISLIFFYESLGF